MLPLPVQLVSPFKKNIFLLGVNVQESSVLLCSWEKALGFSRERKQSSEYQQSGCEMQEEKQKLISISVFKNC